MADNVVNAEYADGLEAVVSSEEKRRTRNLGVDSVGGIVLSNDFHAKALSQHFTSGLRQIHLPTDTGSRTAFVHAWIKRHQRRLAMGLPTSVLILAISSAITHAQEGLANVMSLEGVVDVDLLADGGARVTLVDGRVIVLSKDVIQLGAAGEVFIAVEVFESLAAATTLNLSVGALATVGAGLGLAAAAGGGNGRDRAIAFGSALCGRLFQAIENAA